MIATLAQRRRFATAAAGAAALLLGMLAGTQPKLALGLLAAGIVVLLIVKAPVANVAVLIFLTGVVPYGTQNKFGIGGGERSPGLLLSDLLLIGGLVRAAVALPHCGRDRRVRTYVLVLLVFLGVASLQFLHGLKGSADRSTVGAEFRVLLGFGTFLLAVPLLAQAQTRRRLLAALTTIAVSLGAWGMLQWLGHFSFGAAGDVGVRAGVRLTSAGAGQLQGGEFGYPVALIVCFATLLSGRIRSRLARTALIVAFVLNTAACFVTFERSFWLASLLGIAYVVFRARTVQRLKVLLVAPLALLATFVLLSVFVPTQISTAHERLLSLGQFSSDDSVRYRVTESRFVLDQVKNRPIQGSGLGATIFWGQAWAQVPPKSYTYSHDGYLWLAWKLGVPAAFMLVFLFGSTLLLRSHPTEEQLGRALRHGAQGAIVGLLLAAITFPAFSQLGITPAEGVLLAIAVTRPPRPRMA